MGQEEIDIIIKISLRTNQLKNTKLLGIYSTDSGVSSHVVAIVKADKSQV